MLLPILSHVYSGGMFLRGTRKKRKNTFEEWNNNKPVSPPTDAEEPTLRNSQAFSCPYPQPTPSIPAPAPRSCKGPVFEDACGRGLHSGHRITVWVTGLDTSVRCYPLTHILTGPFWLGQVRGNQRSAAHWRVQRDHLDMGGLGAPQNESETGKQRLVEVLNSTWGVFKVCKKCELWGETLYKKREEV